MRKRRRYYWRNKCLFCGKILDGRILTSLPLLKAVRWVLKCNWVVANIIQTSHGQEINIMCPDCSYKGEPKVEHP